VRLWGLLLNIKRAMPQHQIAQFMEGTQVGHHGHLAVRHVVLVRSSERKHVLIRYQHMVVGTVQHCLVPHKKQSRATPEEHALKITARELFVRTVVTVVQLQKGSERPFNVIAEMVFQESTVKKLTVGTQNGVAGPAAVAHVEAAK